MYFDIFFSCKIIFKFALFLKSLIKKIMHLGCFQCLIEIFVENILKIILKKVIQTF